MHLNQLASLLFCALLISVAFAWLSQPTLKKRFAYAGRYFLYFVVIAFLLGWLMFLLSH